MMRRAVILAIVAGTLAVLGLSINAWARPGASAPWSGTWKRAASEIDRAGPTVFTIHQVGNHLTGTIPWKGCTTRKGGSMVGWAQANAAVLAARETDGTLVLVHLQLSPNRAGITGSYQITAGTCSGSGPFTATRVH
jgi:hypothetical protein